MIEFNLELQKQLVYAALDDFSPNDALPKINGGQYGASPDEWRAAVINMIEYLLILELICPIPAADGYSNLSPNEIKNILEQGDPINNIGVDILWDAIHFSGTDKLKNLLNDFDLAKWSALNSELSAELVHALVSLEGQCAEFQSQTVKNVER